MARATRPGTTCIGAGRNRPVLELEVLCWRKHVLEFSRQSKLRSYEFNLRKWYPTSSFLKFFTTMDSIASLAWASSPAGFLAFWASDIEGGDPSTTAHTMKMGTFSQFNLKG